MFRGSAVRRRRWTVPLVRLRLGGRTVLVFPKFSECVAVHLAAIVLRQRVSENDVLGHLRGGQTRATMVEHVVDGESNIGAVVSVEYQREFVGWLNAQHYGTGPLVGLTRA